MSGDVQPRKRKDKSKKKKDEIGLDEPRGTAAALGEGDVLIHSQQEHGTGGHWCAKIVFFSLLAVLISLVGLIILENRGLSELEANEVQSQYTGLLDGWLEETPDDHHDEHTLELKNPTEDEHDETDHEGEGSEEEEDADLEDLEHEVSEEKVEARRYAEPYEPPAGDVDDEVLGDEELDELEGDQDERDDDIDDKSQEDDADGDKDDDGETDGENEDVGDQSEDDFLQQDEEEDLEDPQDDGFRAAVSIETPYEEEDDDQENFFASRDVVYEGGHHHDNYDAENSEEDMKDNDDDFSAPLSAETPYEEVEESSERLPATDSLLEEEEYERDQEQLRQQTEEEGHPWLKMGVGLALLGATHALMRRARASSDEEEEQADGDEATDDTPVLSTPADRRMTLVPDEPPAVEAKRQFVFEAIKPKRVIREPTPEPEPEPEPESEPEEVEEPEEDEAEEDVIVKTTAKPQKVTKKVSYEEEEVEAPYVDESEEEPDDVEIIDDETVEDQEELGEEEISDVDDVELLTRLEAKYGKLPEPERYGVKKDGANSMIPEEEWGEEPNEERWRRELDLAQNEMNRGVAAAALARAGAPTLKTSPRAHYITARSLDMLAEERKDNGLLTRAIDAYVRLLRDHRLKDPRLKEVAARAIERARFRGSPLAAEAAHRALIQRFPGDVSYRNQLVVSYLMANRMEQAKEELKTMLTKWPGDRVALAHYGFVLKMEGRLEEAVNFLSLALDGGTRGEHDEPRFHYHLGDALLALGRTEHADRVHVRAAKLGHFRSPAQRSLYNVDRLTAKPWWDLRDTPYRRLAEELEANWRDILKEGEAAKASYEAEKEGLRERGEWSQLDILSRGREVSNRCLQSPVTCRVVQREKASATCRRGQTKFSLLQPGTHVRAHVGPTNCRIRVHLALTNTTGAFLRVHNETRQWETGRVLAFDDSFEHEVWHNGTAPRLVLIVDVWHPELTSDERLTLPSI